MKQKLHNQLGKKSYVRKAGSSISPKQKPSGRCRRLNEKAVNNPVPGKGGKNK